MDYYNKYLKYKNKYLELKGGINSKQKRANKRANEIVEELLVEKPTHILFMFLGGLPFNNEHWQKFVETSNEKLIFVVHPMILEGFIDKINGSFWKTKYDKRELLLVDAVHHVKTAWATKSLTDAQLMMMQYAILQKGRIYKKYVLISPNDAPLYNFNVMYKELNSDSKSWFSFFAKKLIRQNWKKLYKHEGGIFDFDDIDLASQWCIIDDSHIEFYFDSKKLSENKPTYKKIEIDFKCYDKPINIVEAILGTDIKYQQYLDATNGYTSNKLSKSELENINNAGLCTVTDGLFFNAILKHELKQRNLKLLDNIKYNKIAYLNDIINHKEYIKPTPWENEYLTGGEKHAFINNNVWNELLSYWKDGFRGEFANKNRIWYGCDLTFNQDRLLLNFIENKDYTEGSWREKKWFLFENGVLKSYNDEEKSRKTNEFCMSLKKYDDIENADKLYAISNSYTDFSLVSLDPNNVLREFQYKKLIKDNKILDLFEGKKINEILKSDPNNNITQLINQQKIGNVEIKVPSEEYTINLKRHPIEYSRWNLIQILNAYNLLIFFEINKEIPEEDFLKDKDTSFINIRKIKEYVEKNKFRIKDVYDNKDLLIADIIKEFPQRGVLFHNILKFKLNVLGLTDQFYSSRPKKNIKGTYAYIKSQYYYKRMIDLNKSYIEECKVDDKIYYIFKEGTPENIKNDNVYGIPLTSFFLNNALTYGALFIRKVGENSKIEEFTNELYKLDEYVLRDNTKDKYSQRPLVDNDSVPYKYRSDEVSIDREKAKLEIEINKLIDCKEEKDKKIIERDELKWKDAARRSSIDEEIKILDSKLDNLNLIYFLKLNNWNWKKARDFYKVNIGKIKPGSIKQHVICKQVTSDESKEVDSD